MTEKGKKAGAGNPPEDPEYGDFLLVDLLRPDWKNFFSRYRVDLLGFAVVAILCGFIIWVTKWLALIGSDGGGTP